MREWIVLGAFAAGVLALGIYPKPLTRPDGRRGAADRAEPDAGQGLSRRHDRIPRLRSCDDAARAVPARRDLRDPADRSVPQADAARRHALAVDRSRSPSPACWSGATRCPTAQRCPRSTACSCATAWRRSSRCSSCWSRSRCVCTGATYLRDRKLHIGEFYLLILFATLGMMLLVSAGNMITVYLGLELLTLSPVRAGRAESRFGACRPKPRSSISCSVRSRRACCCTACR